MRDIQRQSDRRSEGSGFRHDPNRLGRYECCTSSGSMLWCSALSHRLFCTTGANGHGAVRDFLFFIFSSRNEGNGDRKKLSRGILLILKTEGDGFFVQHQFRRLG